VVESTQVSTQVIELAKVIHASNIEVLAEPKPKGPWIEFLSPSEIKAYEPPDGTLLVGNNHIVRGGIGVLGGCPGVGKSRSTVGLAEAGATLLDWLGLPVHCHFRTMIIQNENGKYRLKLEFETINEKVLDQYLRISPPAPFGLRFDRHEFRDELKAKIDTWDPGVIVIDPWNAVAKDDKARDYRETFDLVRDVVPAGDAAPFILICAHTNKPIPKERSNGRALLNLLTGSHVLGSVPRVVWIQQHASDDVAETRVVVTCCKNNDGELGPRSVWNRGNGGLWTPVEEFDWDEWDNPSTEPTHQQSRGITAAIMAVVFEHGKKALKRADARDSLVVLTEKSRSSCYNALALNGKFGDHLSLDQETQLLRWIP
jgi:hypothetical protein